jgi:hypothetical protein
MPGSLSAGKQSDQKKRLLKIWEAALIAETLLTKDKDLPELLKLAFGQLHK